MKTCSKCKETKDRDLFGSNRSRRDGKNDYCKECIKKNSQARRWYHDKWREENRDEVNRKSLDWASKNREKRTDIVKRSEQKNREERLARKRQYYLENKEKYKQWTSSPEVKAAVKARYNANKKNAVRVPYNRKDILEKARFKCAYCGGNARGLDHVVPLSRGGCDTPENVVVCCASCNSSKGNKLISEWKR